MNRRGFLRTIIGGVAAGAAVRTWPFRVYSFPTEPKICTTFEEAMRQYYSYGIAYYRIPSERLDFINLERWGLTPTKYPGKLIE